MSNQDFWTRRFYEHMADAKADVTKIKEFIDNDLELSVEQVSRFDIGHAKLFADRLNEIARLVDSLKKRREEE